MVALRLLLFFFKNAVSSTQGELTQAYRREERLEIQEENTDEATIHPPTELPWGLLAKRSPRMRQVIFLNTIIHGVYFRKNGVKAIL